jgi:hypothetical protein
VPDPGHEAAPHQRSPVDLLRLAVAAFPSSAWVCWAAAAAVVASPWLTRGGGGPPGGWSARSP